MMKGCQSSLKLTSLLYRLKYSHQNLLYINKSNMSYIVQNCSQFVKTPTFVFEKALIHVKFLPRKKYSHFNTLRHSSTLVNVNTNQKLEEFLRTVNSRNLQSKFRLNGDEICFALLQEKENLEENIQQLELIKESEENTKNGNEMVKLIEEDICQYNSKLQDVYEKLIQCLIPSEDFEDYNDIVLEVQAGVGGAEAMLFTSELRNMYCGYFDYKGWEYSIAENYESELGGVRQCSMLISGDGAYATLKHEAGVHRVQRVPATEKGSRMHTSTASVAVLPQPTDVEVNIKSSDLKIETKRASGAGGQHVNTTDSAVRVTHLPTGIVVECQSDRNQHQNKATALKRLKSKIYERELIQQTSSIRSQKKIQVGTSGRSEKIRTYNYRDDRISDHRLSGNIHNLKQFMEGGEPLDKLLSQLDVWHYNNRIHQFLNNLPS